MEGRYFVGKQYNNFKSLEDDLRKFEEENYINLRKRDSHTIKAKKKKGKCMQYKDELVFHDIQYICKHGGDYRPKTNHIRTSTTCKTNCPFTVKFVVNNEGDQLVCTQFKKEHNHEINKDGSLQIIHILDVPKRCINCRNCWRTTGHINR